MGYRTHTQHVPFSITVYNSEFDRRVTNRQLAAYLKFIRDEENETTEIKGWKIPSPLEIRKGDFFVRVLKKKNKVVTQINQSPNYGGGEMLMTFYANNRETLESFCDDWGFDKSDIEVDETVQQTI